MDKRGFTLVELLAVMAILIILAGLTIPVINTSLENARVGAYNKQIALIEAATKKWGIENGDKLPDIGSNSTITVDFDTLIAGDYLKNEKIINPITDEELVGCVQVSYDSEYNQYKYTYTDNVSVCESYNVSNL